MLMPKLLRLNTITKYLGDSIRWNTRHYTHIYNRNIYYNNNIKCNSNIFNLNVITTVTLYTITTIHLTTKKIDICREMTFHGIIKNWLYMDWIFRFSLLKYYLLKKYITLFTSKASNVFSTRSHFVACS